MPPPLVSMISLSSIEDGVSSGGPKTAQAFALLADEGHGMPAVAMIPA